MTAFFEKSYKNTRTIDAAVFCGVHSLLSVAYCGCSPPYPCKAAVSDIHAAIKALLLDCPMLCFFEGKWSYNMGMVYPQYILPGSAVSQLSAEVKAVSESLSGESYPRQVYDWMLSNVVYRPEAANSQNAYGALVQREAACKGIAKGYQLLMRKRKIECILVEGTLDGQGKHIWNMIRYEGKWEHVDVTMGYPCFWSLTGSSDAYGGYRKTAGQLCRSHKIYYPEILPADR